MPVADRRVSAKRQKCHKQMIVTASVLIIVALTLLDHQVTTMPEVVPEKPNIHHPQPR